MTQLIDPPAPSETSYEESLDRWRTHHAAAGYPSDYGVSLRDRREHQCIRDFVETLSPGSRILDLPCGTGRLTPLLHRRGLKVVGADCSRWMVESAAETWSKRPGVRSINAPSFEVRQAMATGYADQSFDAVICNRLFHHFREPEIRTAVLREFGRICRGPIMVSFFNSFAIDAVRIRLKHRLRGTVATDRIPIPMATMLNDVRAAGLDVVAKRAVLWALSPMWYLVVKNPRAAQAAAA